MKLTREGFYLFHASMTKKGCLTTSEMHLDPVGWSVVLLRNWWCPQTVVIGHNNIEHIGVALTCTIYLMQGLQSDQGMP